MWKIKWKVKARSGIEKKIERKKGDKREGQNSCLKIFVVIFYVQSPTKQSPRFVFQKHLCTLNIKSAQKIIHQMIINVNDHFRAVIKYKKL